MIVGEDDAGCVDTKGGGEHFPGMYNAAINCADSRNAVRYQLVFDIKMQHDEMLLRSIVHNIANNLGNFRRAGKYF